MIEDRGDVIIDVFNKLNIKDLYPQAIEVGTMDGFTAGKLVKGIPGLNLTIIDPSLIWVNVFENCKGALGLIRIMNMPSDEAFPKLNRIYDFVFIDGEHSYEQTRRDILNAWRVIKKGGVLFGHNCDNIVESAHPGVYQAVYEIFPKEKVNRGIDVTWWVHV